MNKSAAVMFAVSWLCLITPATAQLQSPPAAEQPLSDGMEEAPGFEDFEKGNVDPEEIREQQEREDDRNVISPSMQDGEPLPGMNADDR